MQGTAGAMLRRRRRRTGILAAVRQRGLQRSLGFAALAACGVWALARGLPLGFVPAPPATGKQGRLQEAAFNPVSLPAVQSLEAEVVPGAPSADAALRERVYELLPAAGALALGLGVAASSASAKLTGDMTPENFRPVCPASDSVYNIGKGLADAALGAEGAEYRPLAIEALLRVRLEICVLESFVYEAIIPFVERKGLGWILPLHETIDTVIAGTVFAIALNFILFGTTKILAVISIYHDFILGAPLRLIGFSIFPAPREPKAKSFIQINWPGVEPEEPPPPEPEEPRPPPAPPVAVIGGVCKGYGIISETLKNIFEGLDTFVGRYLAITSIAYIGFKWAHFRLFNDFFP